MASPTWYDILGVSRDASPEQVKAAWREATDKFEPGTGAAQFKLFNEAAEVLLDPAKRAAYDAELTPEPSAEPAPEPEPDPTPEPEPEPVPVTAAAPAVGSGILGTVRGFATSTLGLGILAVLAIASLVLAGFLARDLQNRADIERAAPEASSVAERALGAVLSYDYQHLAEDRDRAAKYLTPTYRKSYLKSFQQLTDGPNDTPGSAVRRKVVMAADVLATAVVDASKDRVRVLAFVDQKVTNIDGGPKTLQNRVVVTLVHRGDSWLINDLTSYGTDYPK